METSVLEARRKLRMRVIMFIGSRDVSQFVGKVSTLRAGENGIATLLILRL